MKFFKVFSPKNRSSFGFCTIFVLLILSSLLWFGLLTFEHELTVYRIAREQALAYERIFLIESAQTYARIFVMRALTKKSSYGTREIVDWGRLRDDAITLQFNWKCEQESCVITLKMMGKNFAYAARTVFILPNEKLTKNNGYIEWQIIPYV